MILLLDNYDSFVYNLARYLTEMGQESRVLRNDRVSVHDVLAMEPEAIVLSPGPCTPSEAGISLELLRALPEDWPLLGVCLGHQAIAQALGGGVVRAPFPVHGRISQVYHDQKGLFENLPNPMQATRYHSLIVEEATLPEDLVITARTRDGVPMALEHQHRPIFGVQFHPESVLTQGGRRLLENFLTLAGLEVPKHSPEESIAPPITKDTLVEPVKLPRPLHW